MYLVQILLPLFDKEGEQFSPQLLNTVREYLLENYGGITIYKRNVATGLWENSDGEIEKDELLIFEVMTASLKPEWWKNYRLELEKEFEQEEVVIRASEFEKL
jgi:hypothetical protein